MGARILATGGSRAYSGPLGPAPGAGGSGTVERTGGPWVSGTAKLGGIDRHGAESGRECSGSSSAGIRTALWVSGADIPGGTRSGGRLAVLEANFGSRQPTTGRCR
jgi:hypothetical protein